MTIFCNSQQPSSVPTTLAAFQLNGTPYFGLPAKEIRCIYYEGASSFGGMLGSGGQTDVYIGAAIISKAVGKPVRLQWMRWDEHALGSLRPGRDVRREGRRGRERQHHRSRLGLVRSGRHVAQTSTSWLASAPGRRPRATAARHVGHDLQGGRDDQARARQDAAALRRLVQERPAACPGRAAVALRRRAADRRDRLHAEDGPARAPQAEHRRHGRHRCPLAGGARRGREDVRLEGGSPHSGPPRRATSARVAASRSGPSRTRRSAWSPTSRSA